jgi:hypothetical protein
MRTMQKGPPGASVALGADLVVLLLLNGLGCDGRRSQYWQRVGRLSVPSWSYFLTTVLRWLRPIIPRTTPLG